MPFPLRPIEEVPAHKRRVLEHVERLLEGHDLALVATIVVTILTRIVLRLSRSDDPTDIDAVVDDLTVSLKAACRAQLERDRRDGMQ